MNILESIDIVKGLIHTFIRIMPLDFIFLHIFPQFLQRL